MREPHPLRPTHRRARNRGRRALHGTARGWRAGTLFLALVFAFGLTGCHWLLADEDGHHSSHRVSHHSHDAHCGHHY